MSGYRKYALFDWDNTIRRGYTLYSWVEYLHQCNITSIHLQKKLEILKQQYIKSEITHDQYANKACAEYAKDLAGKKVNEIRQLMDVYIKRDRKSLFPEMCKLLKELSKRDIDIIVISGAPFRILEQYKQEFNLKKIYAFQEEIAKGKFTGKVASNYGFDKSKKVQELIEQYGTNPYLAFGDSQSDIPLLDNSDYPICVGDRVKKDGYINVDFKESVEDILHMVNL